MTSRPFLLDTMTVLWMCFRPEWLGKEARQILTDPDSRLAYSIVNLWEIAIKKSKGGYREFVLPEDWERVITEYLDGMAVVMREITPLHCRRIQDLPDHHRDPFDRMLIAQALEDDYVMVSKDEMLEKYGVKRVW
jgi:PIN domain nuclease of toxin-antitoxin system